MLQPQLSFAIAFLTTNNYTGSGSEVTLVWILATGFWDDGNVWLDEQTWNDG